MAAKVEPAPAAMAEAQPTQETNPQSQPHPQFPPPPAPSAVRTVAAPQCRGCDRCNTMVRPLPDKLPTMITHIIAIVIFILGLPFLIFVPYCFNIGGKPAFRCPACGNYLS